MYPLQPSLDCLWPQQLQNILTGCAASTEHFSVTNICQNGLGSDAAAKLAAQALSAADEHDSSRPLDAVAFKAQLLRRADIILVETAVNDILELLERSPQDGVGIDAAQVISVYTEALVRMLLQLPKSPLLLWVAAGRRRFTKDDVNRRDRMSVATLMGNLPPESH